MLSTEQASYLNSIIDKIESAERKQYDFKLQTVKHLTTISFAMLTVLVAFNKPSVDFIGRLIFSNVITMILLSVLSGVLFLLSLIHDLGLTISAQKAALTKRLSGDLSSHITYNLESKWYYRLAEPCFYIFFSLSLLSLVFFGLYSYWNEINISTTPCIKT